MNLFQAKTIKTNSVDPDLELMLITQCPQCKNIFASPSKAVILTEVCPTTRAADPAPPADGEVYFIEWVDANHVRLTKTQGG